MIMTMFIIVIIATMIIVKGKPYTIYPLSPSFAEYFRRKIFVFRTWPSTFYSKPWTNNSKKIKGIVWVKSAIYGLLQI